ncbi:ACR protein [Corynebacterium sp. sy017]|uniref:aminoacyl-tRNA hydrolase n=1 Tax=unclassified Corynebacterium TaxID=2624378 RepID=UPI001185576A|nr:MULTISPECIES: aminoacyl-tRNA hydrolase [unclassified Corynebacterium]MBP3088178.1 ACR protein [Corynebacterium sp. sy017]QDZ43107.1 ACR protein [Corynebacterium sp. sy039]TSD92681.1 ACR protein [Corynebacterium sp. SY003]
MDTLAIAHRRLALHCQGRYSGRPRANDQEYQTELLENPDDPSTIQAMQMVLHLPKQQPPPRADVLAASAQAVVAVCLAPQAGHDGAWAQALERWYTHRIRKVARRARGSAWHKVHVLPGVSVESGQAQVRAFVPSAVAEVPAQIAKLQIHGTDVPYEPVAQPPAEDLPVIYVDRSLGMTMGKTAAQVGHGAMLLAAELSYAHILQWQHNNFACTVREVDAQQFRLACDQAPVRVQDAGFTEIAPGSVTVCAAPRPLTLSQC